MKRKTEKVRVFILAAVLLFLLAGCSTKAEVRDGALQESGEEYVYVPSYQNMGTDGWLGGVSFQDGAVYYMRSSYDRENNTVSDLICKRELTEGKTEEILYRRTYNPEVGDTRYLQTFTVLPEEKIAILCSDYADELGQHLWFLKIFDESGVELSDVDITQSVNEGTEPVFLDSCLADAQGNIYLKGENKILVYDADGRFLFRLSAKENMFQGIGRARDGTVLVAQYVGGVLDLSPIDVGKKDYGKSCQKVPDGLNASAGMITPGLTKDVLLRTSTGLVEYDFASQSYEEVLNWLDCDINSDYVSAIGTTQDGQVVVLIREWKENAINWICTLTKTLREDVPQKQVITLGTWQLTQDLEHAIVNFNRTNGTYKISVLNYGENVDFSQNNAYEDVIMRFNNDILTGNAPDVIDLSLVNYVQYMNKGIIEDLYPYLENSQTISQEDLNASVLAAYSVNGKLACIPSSFDIGTLVAKKSDVGEKTGFTVPDLMILADSKAEDAMLMEHRSKTDMLRLCIMMNEQSYIDWTTGECRFDSDDFKAVLEFANRFPDTVNWEEQLSPVIERIAEGKLLLMETCIYRFEDIQLYDQLYQDDFVFIGYPTADGSNGSAFLCRDTYGIYAKSEQKEGAWAFLETLLTEEYQTNRIMGLPTLNSAYEKELAKSMEKQYIQDEAGNLIPDADGNPVEVPRAPLTYDDFTTECDVVTKEQAEKMAELIANTQKVYSSSGTVEIMNIITEEAAPYFAGQKSIEEAMEVIQSRISVYVSENFQ